MGQSLMSLGNLDAKWAIRNVTREFRHEMGQSRMSLGNFNMLDGNFDNGLFADDHSWVKQEGFLGSSFPLRKFEKSVEDPKDCESLNHEKLDWT